MISLFSFLFREKLCFLCTTIEQEHHHHAFTAESNQKVEKENLPKRRQLSPNSEKEWFKKKDSCTQPTRESRHTRLRLERDVNREQHRHSNKSCKGFVPQSASLLHHTGIPEGITCKRSRASLYICPHPSCGATPYISNLPGCRLHLCRVHYGTCLLCPFCPNKRYYHVSGWKDHINSKHCDIPWYGASEELQAKLTLAALTTPDSSDVAVTQQELPIPTEPASATADPVSTPEPFASFTAPLPLPMPKPVNEEPPLEDTLVYEEDVDPSSSDVSPEMEQSLMDSPPEGGISSIREKLDQMNAILKGANFKNNNGYKKCDKQDLRNKLKGLVSLQQELLGEVRSQCNATIVMGGAIINCSVLMRNQSRVVRNGKTCWGGDKGGGSSSPGTGSQSPTVTSKMGTTGRSLREMLKMPEYHNPDPLVRL